MELAEEIKKRILDQAMVIMPDIINVAGFINHQVDMELMWEVGKALASRFKEKNLDKVLTVEASGIAPSCFASYFLKVPMVYAKKKSPRTLGDDVYSRETYSKTRGEAIPLAVSKRYLGEGEKIVILDDFLATGTTAIALIEMIEEAGGEFCGLGVIIEKIFEGGRENLIKGGVKDEDMFSLVKIRRLDKDSSKIEFL